MTADVRPNPAQEFIFTFGVNHPLGKCYVVVGVTDSTEARELMFRTYGSRWAFQYESREAAGVERYDLREVPFGTPNEENQLEARR